VDVVAASIFVAALAIIALEWVHRTKAALVGAGVVVVVGVVDLDRAIDAVDWATIGLLAGMTIIVGLTEKTGIFTYVALRVAQFSRGKPFRLVFLLSAVTGVMSAFLDNLTAILLVVPITLLLADVLRVSPVPLVLVEVVASNIGGTATLIGDPPNIMIGTHVAEVFLHSGVGAIAVVEKGKLVGMLDLEDFCRAAVRLPSLRDAGTLPASPG
jgi:Na+/H+ antiporter NhaD/arsenite permease-like protein